MTNPEDEKELKEGKCSLEQGSRESKSATSEKPEPPLRYQLGEESRSPVAPSAVPNAQDVAMLQLQGIRRMVTAALIMGLVSLVIGGVVLSAAALVVAIMGYRRVANALMAANEGQAAWLHVRKFAVIAIVISVLALTANVVALVIIYPSFIQAIESGSSAYVFGDVSSGQSGGASTGSVWG